MNLTMSRGKIYKRIEAFHINRDDYLFVQSKRKVATITNWYLW